MTQYICPNNFYPRFLDATNFTQPWGSETRRVRACRLMKLDFGHRAILYKTTKSHMSYDNRIHDFIWSSGLSGVTGIKVELLHFGLLQI